MIIEITKELENIKIRFVATDKLSFDVVMTVEQTDRLRDLLRTGTSLGYVRCLAELECCSVYFNTPE